MCSSDLTEIFPAIQRQLGSDATLTIAGVNQSETIRRLAGPDVRITGHMDDLTDLYGTRRIFVAPTRYAAGLPHKIHEAAARGIPVVATPLLASQLQWTGNELAIAETAEEFAKRCVELYALPDRWNALRAAALDRVIQECSPVAFEESLKQLLQHVQKRKAAQIAASS